jgi:hypothetical protein
MESNRKHWVLPLLLIAVFTGVLLVRAWQPEGTRIESVGLPSFEVSAQPHIEMTIDFGDGELPHEFSAAWHDGMTVQELLESSNSAFAVQGSGTAAFLTELAGVKNEGPGGRNWQFEVNQRWSDRSFGVHKLKPGDHVLWEFAESE